MHNISNIDQTWGIILAGGEGKRLQEFIREKYGTERPKQYSAIIGSRTMLRHTLDRVEKLIPIKQIKVVVDKSHRKYLEADILEREKKSIIIAPENRESAASIYLALSFICCRDPGAIVTIFPSDHFIGEEKRFLNYVENTISFVRKHPGYLALLGIKPTDANSQYGWIEPGKKFLHHDGNRFYRVVRFSEKPGAEQARHFYDAGGLWNSLVISANSETLKKIYRKNIEVIYNAFKRAKSYYGTDEEEKFISDAFRSIPSLSFSKNILEEETESLFVLKTEGILWSDWGNKEQVMKDLDTLGMV